MARLSLRAPAGGLEDAESTILIPQASYIDAVRRTLGVIDLDPCSTAKAQTSIDALGWYRAEEASAALAEPWSGRVFIPTRTRLSPATSCRSCCGITSRIASALR
jgi:hypothetical protein